MISCKKDIIKVNIYVYKKVNNLRCVLFNFLKCIFIKIIFKKIKIYLFKYELNK